MHTEAIERGDTATAGAAWRSLRLPGNGSQPQWSQPWRCQPAWDVSVIHRVPDGEVVCPTTAGAVPEALPLAPRPYFVDRHIDRQYTISYPPAGRGAPRFRGRVCGDPDREWTLLVEHRDRLLHGAGLAPTGDPEAVARVFADSFAWEHFQHKPLCEQFDAMPRALDGPIEGLLYKAYCVGCAMAFAALADSCGLESRTVGCGAHRVAEVRLGGRWHLVENMGRHADHAGLDMLMRASFLDTLQDPAGDHGDHLTDAYRLNLFRRDQGQFHFGAGLWASPLTLRYACATAHALYPERAHWPVLSADGRRLPVWRQSGGFYWPRVHVSEEPEMAARRAWQHPDPGRHTGLKRDFLYHAFAPGQALRFPVFLDGLTDAEEVELTIPIANCRDGAFDSASGAQLLLEWGGESRSLQSLGAWPPVDPQNQSGNLHCTITLPAAAFCDHRTHWAELRNAGCKTYHAACVPAVLEPGCALLGDC